MSDGTHHVEGSTVWGTKIHPSKEAAIAALGTRGTAFTTGHFEWLGAFEVEE